MNKIFLGPLVHWLLIGALIGFGWFAGFERYHASAFNPFLILMIVVVIVIVVAVLLTSPKDRAVTRDPIVEPEDED